MKKKLNNKEENLDNINHRFSSFDNDISQDDSQQKKIDSEITEILRNIDMSYEIISPENESININNTIPLFLYN